MKRPQNYNAGATKKINPLEAAINSNFSQTESVNTAPEAREELLRASNATSGKSTRPEASQAQISNDKSQILNAEPVSASIQHQQARAQETISVQQAGSESPKTPARREVKEKFLVSMSKGERSVFKSFCALQGVSMNHFVMCAMDYFKEDLENGKVSISSHSYKRKDV